MTLDPTELEAAVLSKCLEGGGNVLADIRQQLIGIRVQERDFTGVGFYAKLLPNNCEMPPLLGTGRIVISDVVGDLDNLSTGVGFVLYLENGIMTLLEGFTYDEPWPERIGRFAVRFLTEDRREIDLRLLA